MNMRREALERKTINVKKKRWNHLRPQGKSAGANGGSSEKNMEQAPPKQVFPLLHQLTYLRNFSLSSLD